MTGMNHWHGSLECITGMDDWHGSLAWMNGMDDWHAWTYYGILIYKPITYGTNGRTLLDVKSLSRLKRGCLVFGCVIETSEEFYES